MKIFEVKIKSEKAILIIKAKSEENALKIANHHLKENNFPETTFDYVYELESFPNEQKMLAFLISKCD